MITTIQLKRGLEEDWEYTNPILKIGEPGYATDMKVLKIGDGVTAWNGLESYGISEDKFDNLTDTPTTKIPKKLVKVSDDGQDLEYTTFDVDQILQTSAIDVADPSWQIGEQRLVTVEKSVSSTPELKGATQLVDLTMPSATITLLENPNGWTSEMKTITGFNFFGELGKRSQIGTGIDGTIYICESSDKGTEGVANGSAAFSRNRSVDALDPDTITNDSNIVNLLNPSRTGGGPDDGWDIVNNVKIINTLTCRVGSWFTESNGYFFACFKSVTSNYYWRRIGQPLAIQRPINSTSYPNLTANLLANDFTIGSYTGTVGDEVSFQDQTYYDEASRRLFWKVKTGSWEEIQLVK